MATSNKERVGQGLELLAAGLVAVRGRGDVGGRAGRAGLGGDA